MTSPAGPKRHFTDLFLRRPVLAIVVNVVILIAGLQAIRTISVRQCLALERTSIIRLDQSAGEDLMVIVKGIRLAKGEVVVVEDSTSVRLTEICKSGLNAASAEPQA